MTLYKAGGEDKHFAELFVGVHGGDWPRAKDHWTRVGQHVGDRTSELEGLSQRKAKAMIEDLARTVCLDMAAVGACWACGRDTVNR
ncbi:hypothetical protein [Streptomyces griseorubiginosus]|uniref:hypothetical protein n=1 Tax=Streptomyces griseorubiginosus TaxID=67304 RepID=UPI0036E8A307